MKGKPKKPPREKDLTSRYLSGGMDEDRIEQQERFSDRSKNAQHDKMMKTAAMRAGADDGERDGGGDIDALPIGEIVQVFSRYVEVQHEDTTYLATVRKTLAKVSDTGVVVGDRVRFRATGQKHESGQPEASIERVLPRDTVLTRTDSFKARVQHPIVANAQQMLIVASLLEPRVKWGLVDRMIVAALGGGLKPIVALNKVDLADGSNEPRGPEAITEARDVLAHYETMGVRTMQTSVAANAGFDELRDVLRDKVTVLAGHSGVGKSSLIRAVQPQLDLRVGAVSRFTEKGRHTTTSARSFPLEGGGKVIDTPGVKLFGLWNVTGENLLDYFPDVAGETAPEWRRASFERIAASVPPQ